MTFTLLAPCHLGSIERFSAHSSPPPSRPGRLLAFTLLPGQTFLMSTQEAPHCAGCECCVHQRMHHCGVDNEPPWRGVRQGCPCRRKHGSDDLQSYRFRPAARLHGVGRHAGAASVRQWQLCRGGSRGAARCCGGAAPCAACMGSAVRRKRTLAPLARSAGSCCRDAKFATSVSAVRVGSHRSVIWPPLRKMSVMFLAREP